MDDIKSLAFYLPQFHPIPENDEWWGKGFTEWTNVRKAKPLYKGHKQPKVPADLGYYDLRSPEVREQQVALAKAYGLSGFIYYHYWFGNGFQVLEGIANAILKSKQPDFPFCFCWANETWSGRWHGLDDRILAKQDYPGDDDIERHFKYLLPFFKDERYIKIEGKPVFVIYRFLDLVRDGDNYIEKLRALAKKNGFKDLYIIASNIDPDSSSFAPYSCDAKISYEVNRVKYKYREAFSKRRNSFLNRLKSKINSVKQVTRLNAEDMFAEIEFKASDVPTFPMVLPNWDNTPRSAHRGEVFENTSPSLFKKELKKAINYLKSSNYSDKFIIIKSWNEWAEGNYLEPDTDNGHEYLQALKEVLIDANND